MCCPESSFLKITPLYSTFSNQYSLTFERKKILHAAAGIYMCTSLLGPVRHISKDHSVYSVTCLTEVSPGRQIHRLSTHLSILFTVIRAARTHGRPKREINRARDSCLKSNSACVQTVHSDKMSPDHSTVKHVRHWCGCGITKDVDYLSPA